MIINKDVIFWRKDIMKILYWYGGILAKGIKSNYLHYKNLAIIWTSLQMVNIGDFVFRQTKAPPKRPSNIIKINIVICGWANNPLHSRYI